MHLARHSVTSSSIPSHNAIVINQDGDHFAAATEDGFEVWRLYPLANVARRKLGGSLAHASLLHGTSLVFLVGGGSDPLYAPNKLVLWDDAQGRAVLELEFRERVLGLATRRGTFAIAFRRRVVVFAIDLWDEPSKTGRTFDVKGKGKAREEDFSTRAASAGQSGLRWVGEWETYDNPTGLLAMSTAPGSTLLAIPGRQPGHVHLLHLPPCPSHPNEAALPLSASSPPPPKSSIVIAHNTPLSSISCPPSGVVVSTSSERGTLLRIWDGRSGALVRELRRGLDKAVIWGVGWRRDGRRLGVWSDKGTVHVFSLSSAGSEPEPGDKNRPSKLSRLKPFLPVSLPKYFSSEWSHAQYKIPSHNPHAEILRHDGGGEDRCVVGWIEVDLGDRSPEEDGTKVSKPFGASKGVRTVTPNPLQRRTSSSGTSVLTNTTSQPSIEHQLVALTYSGGWYRLALPSSTTAPPAPPPSSSSNRRSPSDSATAVPDDDDEMKPGVQCRLVEYRRFAVESPFSDPFEAWEGTP